jgi:hypothetical protein
MPTLATIMKFDCVEFYVYQQIDKHRPGEGPPYGEPDRPPEKKLAPTRPPPYPILRSIL